MKVPHFMRATLAISAVFYLGLGDSRAEKPEQPANQNRSVPFKDYWDAKSWDRADGSFFWHRLKEHRAQKKAVKERRRAAESPGSAVRNPHS